MFFTLAKQTFVSNVRLKTESIAKPYYGMNVSKAGEPLDQLDFLLLAKKLMVPVIIFVAGRYRILNDTNVSLNEIDEKEMKKIELIKRIMEIFRVNGNVLPTNTLWDNPLYWEVAAELAKTPQIIDKSAGIKFADIPKERFGISQEAIAKFDIVKTSIGNYPGSALYTLLEVAEASCLQRALKVDCKIGPESEERYDKFIEKFMGIVQLYQPLDLRSTEESVKPVIPYMERLQEERVFLTDKKEDMLRKVYKTAQRANGSAPFWKLNQKPIPNPFTRLVILAIESAANSENLPIVLRSKSVYSSEEAVEYIEKSRATGLTDMTGTIGEAIWNYILKPVQQVIT